MRVNRQSIAENGLNLVCAMKRSANVLAVHAQEKELSSSSLKQRGLHAHNVSKFRLGNHRHNIHISMAGVMAPIAMRAVLRASDELASARVLLLKAMDYRTESRTARHCNCNRN